MRGRRDALIFSRTPVRLRGMTWGLLLRVHPTPPRPLPPAHRLLPLLRELLLQLPPPLLGRRDQPRLVLPVRRVREHLRDVVAPKAQRQRAGVVRLPAQLL